MKIWDSTQNKEIDAPWNVERFMEQVSRLCKEYNLSLAHEDRHGAFVIEEYKEEKSGIELIKLNNGYQLCSKKENYDYIYQIIDLL